ncbi:metallophosphoesterase [Sphingobacterium cellulitidis]|uniref:Metallophosphatase n=1 Tax=Sphingobacterium cellulitidis TaxID=1768011 RepID=A0A8H9G1I8_9SPHI|nr:metallophosphoesterase [Sphingobacterium soli]MBA8988115.1 5'-nucleotidase [Sphingobacterium soli]GGE29454.1 metallophosphatase [Sphingobacterium soli]
MEELKSLNRRSFLKIMVALGATASLSAIPFAGYSKSKEVKITFLHTNDVHSRIEPYPMDGSRLQGLGGVARRSTLIQKIRSEEKNVLLFDAGDMFQGTPYFNVFDGKIELELMSKLGYDAGTFGNHEFDNGLPGLLKHFDKANFPFVTSNYDFTGTIMEGKTKDYLVFNRDGVKIGVFAVGVDLKGLVDPKSYQGVKISDPIEVAQKYTHKLKKELKCDLIICLSHIGYNYDTDKVSDLHLAKNSRDIDLIIGGHTHTFLTKPTEVKNLDNQITLVNQTGFSGVNLGRIDFILDKKKGTKRSIATTYTIDKSLDKESSRIA